MDHDKTTKSIILSKMKGEILKNFLDLRTFILMIKPVSEEDGRWLSTFYDMLEQLCFDIEHAEELSDLSDWFKLQDVINDWSSIDESLVKDYSKDVLNISSCIMDLYDRHKGANDGE